MKRIGCILLIGLLGATGVACAGGNAASQLAKSPQFTPSDQTRCAVSKSQVRPLIVEWPSSDRLQLEAKARRSLVAVRYVGCEMEVLDRCTVPGRYRYVGGTRKEDKVEVRDEDELYLNLPVGAARLEGKLQRAGKLTVDMSLVGRWEAERETVHTEELEGDCTGATHFIYGVTVGAFDFYAGGDAEVGGRAGVGAVGAGGQSNAHRETLSRDGDSSACAKASTTDTAPPEGCGALIRIEVVQLGNAAKVAPTCPEGAQWDGGQCVAKRVVTQVECPGGTTWNGSKCAAATDTSCPGGMHFEAGRGCVADVAAPPLATTAESKPPPPPPPQRNDADKPNPGSGQRLAGILMGVGGLGGAVVGTIYGLQSFSFWHSSSNECNTSACSNHSLAVADHDNAVTAATISTIGFVGAGALLVAGTALYFTAPSNDTARGSTALRFLPSAGPQGGGVIAQGAF